VRDDRRARLGVRERVVVLEVLETGGHRGRREPVGLSRWYVLSRDLQAAHVVVGGGGDEARRGCTESITPMSKLALWATRTSFSAKEVKSCSCSLQKQGVDDVRRHDPVDAHVPLEERVVARSGA
jgi:hypothetical protein